MTRIGGLFIGGIVALIVTGNAAIARVVDEEGKQCIKAIYQTNYNTGFAPGDEIKNNEVDTPIFNSGYVLYSREFAEKFHYPEEFISEELGEGLDVVEYRVVTEGGSNRCRMNVLLKAGQGLDLPKDDIVMRYQRRGMRIRFPRKYTTTKGAFAFQGYGPKASDKRDQEVYFSRNIRIATSDYNWPKSGGMTGIMLVEYSNEYYEGYDYLSLGLGCRGLLQKNAKKTSRKDLTLWLKKEGGKDYRKTDKEDKSEFKVYNIPNRLQSEVKRLTQDINSHDHFRALQSYDNKWDTLCKELVDKDNVR